MTSRKVVADNVLLAVRYPGVAAYGCVVADGGGKSVQFIRLYPCRGVKSATLPNRRLKSCFVPPIHSVHIPERVAHSGRQPRKCSAPDAFFFDSDVSEAPTIPLCCTLSLHPTRMRTSERLRSVAGAREQREMKPRREAPSAKVLSDMLLRSGILRR